MAKLADARDLKSLGLILRTGSSPVTRTKKTSNSINVGCSFLLLISNISKYEVRSANAQIPFDNKD